MQYLQRPSDNVFILHMKETGSERLLSKISGPSEMLEAHLGGRGGKLEFQEFSLPCPFSPPTRVSQF